MWKLLILVSSTAVSKPEKVGRGGSYGELTKRQGEKEEVGGVHSYQFSLSQHVSYGEKSLSIVSSASL